MNATADLAATVARLTRAADQLDEAQRRATDQLDEAQRRAARTAARVNRAMVALFSPIQPH